MDAYVCPFEMSSASCTSFAMEIAYIENFLSFIYFSTYLSKKLQSEILQTE